jgi:hypothetical protein
MQYIRFAKNITSEVEVKALIVERLAFGIRNNCFKETFTDVI